MAQPLLPFPAYKLQDQNFIKACFEMTDHDVFGGFTPDYVQRQIPSFVLKYPDCTKPLPPPAHLDAETKDMWNVVVFLKKQLLTKRGESTVSATNHDGTSTAFAFASQPISQYQPDSSLEQCAANAAASVAAETKAPDVLEVDTKYEAEVYGPVHTKGLATQAANITAHKAASRSAQAVAEKEAMAKPNTTVTKSVSVTVQNTATVHIRVREDGQTHIFTETVTVFATASHTAIFCNPHARASRKTGQ